jgi:hypothetical protein
MRHVRRKCGTIEQRLGGECFEHGEYLSVVNACRLVLAARDKVGPVRRELQVRDDVHVGKLIRENLLARARVEQHELARLVARQDQTLHLRERADGHLALNRVENRLCTTLVNARQVLERKGYTYARCRRRHDGHQICVCRLGGPCAAR